MMFRSLLLAAALLAAHFSPASGQAFPSRPVRLIVGTPPGGGIDVIARILAPKLQEQLGNPVIVENKPGASGSIGAEFVARAAPDGHTLLSGFSGQMVMNPVVQEKISFDPLRDFEPVTMLGLFPVVLVAHPSLPVNSVRELIAHAKANPGKLNDGSGSAGFFYVAEAFKQLTGTDIRSIPFTGSAPTVGALLADTVQLAFLDFPPTIGHIRSGRLKALGVTTARRVPFLPGVPAVAEDLPGYEFVLWTALFAPAGTPKEIVVRLQQETVRAMDAPEVQEKLFALGVVPLTGTPQALGDTVRRDLEWIRKLARSAGSAGK